jgi:hypothetical protein
MDRVSGKFGLLLRYMARPLQRENKNPAPAGFIVSAAGFGLG